MNWTALTPAEAAARHRQGALLLNWFDIEPGHEQAFDDWHNREHVIERMGVPGFTQGRRFEVAGKSRAPGHSYLVAYDASDIGVFESGAYAARLDNPTPLTASVVPFLRNLTRTVYRVEARRGGGTAAFVRTLRLRAKDGGAVNAAALCGAVDAIYAVSGVSAVVVGSPDGRVTHFKDKTQEGQATQTLVRDDYPWVVMIEACRAQALEEATHIVQATVENLMPGALIDCDTYGLVFSMTTEQGST
jgi:hypothetical protein